MKIEKRSCEIPCVDRVGRPSLRYSVRIQEYLSVIIRKEDRHMDEYQLPGAEPDPDRGAGTAPDTGGPIMDSPADGDFDEWVDWLDREVAGGGGRAPAPRERDSAAEGISISLGDAVGIDAELLAAMCGPQGLGGEGLGA